MRRDLPPLLSAISLGCVILFMAVSAQASPISWSGSVKSLNLYGESAPAGLFPEYWLSSNRARLETSWQFDQHWQFDAALDYQYLYSDRFESFSFSGRSFNRHLDMEKDHQHGEDAVSRLQMDRLKLQWREGPMDLAIGRQAVGFGRILIASPLDVIAPFAPDAIDTDVRNGVDAMQTIFNYGLDGQLGAIAVWGEEPRYNSYLATWSDNTKGMDLLLIGGRLRGRNMIGTGIAGSIGTLGLKGEVSFHDGRDTDQIGGDLHESYAIAAIETWYRFNNGISLVTQYLYNGPGADDPEDYPAVIASAPRQEGLTYLLGQHYLIVAPAYEIHPLATLQGLLIYNLSDQSALVRPTLDLSLADNISLQIFWTMHFGQEPDTTAAPLAVPRSEFGLAGDSGGVFLKCFF